MRKKVMVMLLLAVLMTGCGSKSTVDINKHIVDADVIVTDASAAAEDIEIIKNPYSALSVPTQVNKIGEDYFIVDCYNNQVIYNDNMTDPLYEWKVMTSDIAMGHTVASDGTVYLVDDTENNRVVVFEKYNDKFVETQVVNDVGIRPHYAVYDDKRDAFYVWSSMTGQMYVLRRDKSTGQIYVNDIMQIDALDGIYVRSFTIVEDDVYFVSGNVSIIKASLDDLSVSEIYEVPVSMAGMVQMMPVDNGYLITISTDVTGDQSYATIIYVNNLEGLKDGVYTDVYENFVGGGTPYYITYLDGRYYLTEHRVPGHSVWSFECSDGIISDVKAVY